MLIFSELDACRQRLVATREFLRGLGLIGTVRKTRAQGPDTKKAEEYILLTILRAATALAASHDQDAVYDALSAIDGGIVAYEDQFGFYEGVSPDHARLNNVLEKLLASKCANAFSPSLNEDEMVERALKKMFHFLSPPESWHLRYHAASMDSFAANSDLFFETPLWADADAIPETPSTWITTNQPRRQSLFLFQQLDDEKWSFWREWYQGFLDGKPLDWELQKEIALIPDQEWEKGPERIAELIEQIRKRRELEAAIADLKAELTAQRASIAQRTHNHPPETVEDQEVQCQFTIIWDHLTEIEDEIAEDEPSVSRLKTLFDRTLAYAKAFALYVASLGDAALKSAAKELGSTGAKWVVRMGVAYSAILTPPIQSGLQKVAELLSELIKVLQ